MNQSVSEMADESEDKTRLRLWLKLLKLSRQIEGELRENLRLDFETTLPRFDVLASLYRFPKGLRMNELSAVLKVSNGNVTGIVNRLVNDALVIRVAVPGDRRALLVKLTPAGKKLFVKQAVAHESWINTMLSNLSTDDANLMIALAEKALTNESEEQRDND